MFEDIKWIVPSNHEIAKERGKILDKNVGGEKLGIGEYDVESKFIILKIQQEIQKWIEGALLPFSSKISIETQLVLDKESTLRDAIESILPKLYWEWGDYKMSKFEYRLEDEIIYILDDISFKKNN